MIIINTICYNLFRYYSYPLRTLESIRFIDFQVSRPLALLLVYVLYSIAYTCVSIPFTSPPPPPPPPPHHFRYSNLFFPLKIYSRNSNYLSRSIFILLF